MMAESKDEPREIKNEIPGEHHTTPGWKWGEPYKVDPGGDERAQALADETYTPAEQGEKRVKGIKPALRAEIEQNRKKRGKAIWDKIA